MTTLFFDQALLPGGWARDVLIEFDGGCMGRVTPDAPKPAVAEHHAIALPGVPNAHSHAFQRAMAGRAERRGTIADSFWTWREQMYRFAHRMTPDDVEAVATQLYMEMLEAGFTRVGEFHYLHHDIDGRPYADIAEMAGRIAAASVTSGIGLTLLPVFYAHGDFGAAPASDGQRRFLCDVDTFERLLVASRSHLAGLSDAKLGVAPHSLRAATPDEISAIVGLHPSGPIHIHAAEQMREVEACLTWSGKRPVQLLLEDMQADARWCIIHATHMTDAETRGMAAAGVVAGLCPITEANLGDGIFNGPEFAGAGGVYGIGSDSNVLIGVPDELRQLEYAQRLRLQVRNAMAQHEQRSTGRTLFDAAVCGGARALGVPTAGIAPGAPADIVTLDMTSPLLAERTHDEVLDAWIFTTRGADVDCVWRAGDKVVRAGRHVRRAAITARFLAAMNRLMA